MQISYQIWMRRVIDGVPSSTRLELSAVPRKGEILQHVDKHYRVTQVVHKHMGEIVVLVEKAAGPKV